MKRWAGSWSAVPRVSLIGVLAGAACAGDRTGPTLPPCSAGAGFSVALGIGQHAAIDPAASSGCFAFAANGGPDSAEYLVVPQSASGTAGVTTGFGLAGAAATATGSGLSAAPTADARVQGAPERFHELLRRAERERAWGRAGSALEPAPAAHRAVFPPPVVGDRRVFSVCATTTCARFDRVTAVAQAVGQRLAIYVDTAAPVPGLSAAELDSLGQLFDTQLYAVDTAAFGAESDVDANTVVIVLMTNVVNRLVTAQQCADEGFVAGFFLGADIDPRFANDSRFNHGEVIYTLVADQTGTLSCDHSRDQVKRLIPVTFVHEFQHMISFNQRALVRNGDGEELWLSEALAHFAEEVGARSFLPGDQASFSRFLTGNLLNAYEYLDDTGAHFLLAGAGISTLAERGAQWLFVRYLVDQLAADTSQAAQNVVTRGLVATTLEGSANVQNRTGRPFAETVSRWALANWVSDLPGFMAPPELTYTSWQFRTTYASLHAQAPGFFPKPFPLVPTVSAGEAVNLSGTLRAGSGVFHRIIQPPGAAAFTLSFGNASGGALPGQAAPRLTLVRIR